MTEKYAYLDNSATTRPTDGVIAAMTRAMQEGFYNPSAVYAPAVSAMRELRDARETILRAVKGSGCRVIFTSGGTEANNLAILGSHGALRGEAPAAVSQVEHPSVLEPFRALEKAGHKVCRIGVNGRGELNFDALQEALDAGIKLVSVMQVNNETGAITDLARVREVVGRRALIHVDGVQGFLRVPFDMKWADMYTLSSHKIHGPKGVGALVVREGVRLIPRQIGGGQEQDLRSGTENTPGIAGLHQAVREMQDLGKTAMDELLQRKLCFVACVKEQVPGAILNGPDPENAAPHIVNIAFPGMRGEVMLHALEAEHVYVSTGAACSSKKKNPSATLIAMGVPKNVAESSIRFSLSPHTTVEELEYAAEAIGRIYGALSRYQRS